MSNSVLRVLYSIYFNDWMLSIKYTWILKTYLQHVSVPVWNMPRLKPIASDNLLFAWFCNL